MFSELTIFSSISHIIILAGGALTGLCVAGASQNLLTLSREEHAANPIFNSNHLKESKCFFGTVAPLSLNRPRKVRIATLSGVFQLIFTSSEKEIHNSKVDRCWERAVCSIQPSVIISLASAL